MSIRGDDISWIVMMEVERDILNVEATGFGDGLDV